MYKPLDELPIVPHQAQKGLDVHVSFGWGELSYSFSILFAGLHAFLRDMMDQMVNVIPEEFTLRGILPQVVFLEVIEHNMQTLQVLLLHL